MPLSFANSNAVERNRGGEYLHSPEGLKSLRFEIFAFRELCNQFLLQSNSYHKHLKCGTNVASGGGGGEV